MHLKHSESITVMDHDRSPSLNAMYCDNPHLPAHEYIYLLWPVKFWILFRNEPETKSVQLDPAAVKTFHSRGMNGRNVAIM